MSALATFFASGGEVPIGGLLPVNVYMAGTLGSRFDQGNKTYFRQGYWEVVGDSNIRGYGAGNSGTWYNSPTTHNASVLVGTTIYLFPTGNGTTFYKSSDYKNYTTGTLPATMVVRTAFYDSINNKLIIMNTAAQMYVSSDLGNTWTTGTNVSIVGGTEYGMITYTGTKYLFINNNNTAWSSTDGATWTSSTPTGLTQVGDGTKICSNGAGRVVAIKYPLTGSSTKSASIFTSSDHGVTFTKVNTGYTLWGAEHIRVAIEYNPQFDYYSYVGITAYSSPSANTSISVAISTDGVTFVPCLNPTVATDTGIYSISTAMPVVFGNPRTKQWHVWVDGAATFSPGLPFNTIPEVTQPMQMYLTRIQISTFGGVGHMHRLPDGETVLAAYNNMYSVRPGKSYKENNYSPNTIVGSVNSASDPNLGGTIFYVRVK